MSEWKMDQGEHYNSSVISGRGVSSEVTLDSDTLEVSSEQGSGYFRERVTTRIPLEVLVKLLTHAGYTVEKR